MSGCFTVLIVCMVVYLAAFLPFLVLPYLSVEQLLTTLAIAALPSFAVGAVSVRLTGLSGAVGFAGGALGQAVFLFLRIESVTAIQDVPGLQTAEYGPGWQFLAPAAWLLAAATIILFSWPNKAKSAE